jgi:hypothetical protein
LREVEKIRPGDLMMVADLAAPHSAKERLGPIGAGERPLAAGNALPASRRRGGIVLGLIDKLHPERKVRTPNDMAPVYAAVRRNPQRKLIRQGRCPYSGDLSAAVGKIANDARQYALAVIEGSGRIPLDTKVLTPIPWHAGDLHHNSHHRLLNDGLTKSAQYALNWFDYGSAVIH